MARRRSRSFRARFRTPSSYSSDRVHSPSRAWNTRRSLPLLASVGPVRLSRRRSPPAFFASRLRDSRLILGPRSGALRSATRKANLLHVAKLVSAAAEDSGPCTYQHKRREILFANRTAGGSWGTGRGPFPKAMREMTKHGCSRRR